MKKYTISYIYAIYICYTDRHDNSWGSHTLPLPFLYFIQMDLKIAEVQNQLPHSRNYLKDVMSIDNWENYFR